jgi:hypothetical protein
VALAAPMLASLGHDPLLTIVCLLIMNTFATQFGAWQAAAAALRHGAERAGACCVACLHAHRDLTRAYSNG